MFKALLTVFRGTAAEAGQQVIDDNLLTAVGQQIRDVTCAIAATKRALALSIVHDKGEAARRAVILATIAELETRAVAALRGGREDLAAHAADAIAGLEAEQAAIEEHRRTTAKQIDDLRFTLRDAGFRLANIERMRRIAIASEAARRLKARSNTSGLSVLAEAEANLQRLRTREIEEADVERTLDAIEAEDSPACVSARLEAEGFGPQTKTGAADVLVRLRRKAEEEAPAPSPLLAFPATQPA